MTRDIAELVAQVRRTENGPMYVYAADMTDDNAWRFSRHHAVKLLHEFVDACEQIVAQQESR